MGKRPPAPPTEPPVPPPAAPEPSPIIPSWDEPAPFEREIADRLLDQRIITVSGRLDESTANQVTSRLLLLGQTSGQAPITLHLSCSESDLGASLALADAVELTAAPVHAVAHGTVRGPAVAVLCAAAKRVAHPHALFVLSVPEASGEGTADRLTSLAEQYAHQVEQLRRRIAAVTGRPLEDVATDLDAGRLLPAEEAKDYGLVEEVL